MSCMYATVLVCLCLFVTQGQSQYVPFMGDFFQNMNQMMGGLQTMTQQLMANGQRMIDQNMQYASAARSTIGNLRPGERRVFNDGNGRGFAYRSPDGSFSSYSFTSGGPNSHGFMFYNGPDGVYERRW